MYPVAILAGGLATRLYPITEKIPKAMLDINGEPFIAHQLRLLASLGTSRVVICAGYLGEQIQAYVQDGSHIGLQVNFVFDGPRLLGTGGAIRNALPYLGGSFFVLYGDSYLPCNFQDVQRAFEESKCDGLMTVYQNEGRWDTSNVVFNDSRIMAYDKKQKLPEMKHIDYGLSVFNASVFERFPLQQAFDLSRVFQELIAAGRLAGYEVKDRFYEIGSHGGLEDLRRFLGPSVPITRAE